MSAIAIDVLEDRIRRDDGPKYQRVISAFETCIRQGRFRPGDRVPNETQLSAQLPLSLGTLQKAMKELVDSGFLVRHRKTGTFIADRKSQVDEVYVYRFRDVETGALLMPSTRTLAVTAEKTPGPWADALGTLSCVRVDRLVWVDCDPPAFSAIYVAPEHGAHMLDLPVHLLHGSSLHRTMIERFNLPTLYMKHRVSCRTLSSNACHHLRVPEGEIGLVWDVSDFSFGDKPSLFQRFEMLRDHRPMELIETGVGASTFSKQRTARGKSK